MRTRDLEALLASLGWEVVGVDVGVHAYYHPTYLGCMWMWTMRAHTCRSAWER